MLKLKVAAFTAFGAFALSGALQHFGAMPVTAAGTASESMLKAAVHTVIPSAHAGGMCSAAKARARAKLLSSTKK